MLYGLIYARYILTTKGLAAMLEKFKNCDFRRCPRVSCSGQPCLPMGQSDVHRTSTIKTHCPKWEDLYYPRSKHQARILLNFLPFVPRRQRTTVLPRPPPRAPAAVHLWPWRPRISDDDGSIEAAATTAAAGGTRRSPHGCCTSEVIQFALVDASWTRPGCC